MPKTVMTSTPVRRRRKALGQHFLVDARIANRIVAAAEPDGSDTVLEIGPGAGVLTRRLVEQAGRVVAVELDQRLCEELPQRMGFPSNLEVVRGDGREIEPDELVGPATPYKVVANLPYYAAAPIVRRLLGTSEAAEPDGGDGAARGGGRDERQARGVHAAVGGDAVLR